MSIHGNISVFVPHIGCPHRCSFCDQNAITGSVKAPDKNDVIYAVETAMRHKNYNAMATELAFFGGSFTAIEEDYMLHLLEAGYDFVKKGVVSGIRVSTRPDAISSEILEVLKSHGVTAIELGCQSLSNEVLKLNHRGHTAEQVEKSAYLIKQNGFSLGLQMMTGLYGDNNELSLQTAEKIISYGADTVRIYPTIVLSGTYLHRLFEKGEYCPQTLDEAVSLTAELLKLFEESSTKVIRVGLHAIESERFVAGPWHPAFGELCKSRVLLNKALKIVKNNGLPKGDTEIIVPFGMKSAMIGQKKANIEFLSKMGYNCKVIESNIKDIVLRSKDSAN